MRITDIELYSNNVEAVNFKLRDLDPTDQYIIRNMTGLDAEELIPKFYGAGLQTRAKFYEFLMKPRDIVMKIALNPRFKLDESYSDIRDDLYRTISSSRVGSIALRFNASGTTVARTSGFITKFETTHFDQVPEVQITVRCDDPMLRSINSVIYDLADLNTINPVIIADDLSTAPHGFMFIVTFKAASPTLTIQDVNTSPDWKFVIYPNGGFLTGDVLYFSSDIANKYLYMVRSGVTTYLMDKIEPNSIWPILFPGANSFWIPEIATFNWTKVEFYAAYWGV